MDHGKEQHVLPCTEAGRGHEGWGPPRATGLVSGISEHLDSPLVAGGAWHPPLPGFPPR